MGLIESKSPQERRNTVVRRSQRKSVHGIKAKTTSVLKDIKKFKGVTEEDPKYAEIVTKIENLHKELEIIKQKNLQPEVRNVHKDTLQKVEDCVEFLKSKLKENQEAANKKASNTKPAEESEEPLEDIPEQVQESDLAEAVNDEMKNLEESTNKRKTVELTLVQVHSLETTPKEKRKSILKMGGVPVMPAQMEQALLRRKSQDLDSLSHKMEQKVTRIRTSIQLQEEEISRFVGRKYGLKYNEIREKLLGFVDDLEQLQRQFDDEEFQEQIKLNLNYISSCSNFLDEKSEDAEESGQEDEVFESPATSPKSTLSQPPNFGKLPKSSSMKITSV